MREKLIELIGQVQYLGGLELALADHLISNGVTIQKWIPVTERLPKGTDGVSICENVIAYLNCDDVLPQVCPGWLNGDKWYLIVDDDDYNTIWSFESVTHWMPLPEPPKEEDNATD